MSVCVVVFRHHEHANRSDNLTRPCFLRYADNKCSSGMKQYRMLGDAAKTRKQHKHLLPLSFGASSSVLLHMINGQVEHQLAGPLRFTNYDVHVLVVDPSTISPSRPPCQKQFDLVRQHYPRHKYTMIPLHSIFEYDPNISETLRQIAGSGFGDDESKPYRERLEAFRASIPTTTSKDDIDNILLFRLIVAFARHHACETILWGDSDTRLAAKTLANVAKGRGASLTWQVRDGPTPWGLEFIFPLRELYRTELEQYAKLVPTVESIVIPDPPASEALSNRDLSIDELLNNYVLTQGVKYPGIMANVVRTVNKLQPAGFTSDQARCVLCTSPIEPDNHGADGAEAFDFDVRNAPTQFCYGCRRSAAGLSQAADT